MTTPRINSACVVASQTGTSLHQMTDSRSLGRRRTMAISARNPRADHAEPPPTIRQLRQQILHCPLTHEIPDSPGAPRHESSCVNRRQQSPHLSNTDCHCGTGCHSEIYETKAAIPICNPATRRVHEQQPTAGDRSDNLHLPHGVDDKLATETLPLMVQIDTELREQNAADRVRRVPSEPRRHCSELSTDNGRRRDRVEAGDGPVGRTAHIGARVVALLAFQRLGSQPSVSVGVTAVEIFEAIVSRNR